MIAYRARPPRRPYVAPRLVVLGTEMGTGIVFRLRLAWCWLRTRNAPWWQQVPLAALNAFVRARGGR